MYDGFSNFILTNKVTLHTNLITYNSHITSTKAKVKKQLKKLQDITKHTKCSSLTWTAWWNLAKTKKMSRTNAGMDLPQHTFQLGSLHSYEWETRQMSQEALREINNIVKQHTNDILKLSHLWTAHVEEFHLTGSPPGTVLIWHKIFKDYM